MVKHTGILSELLLRNRHSLMLSFTLQRYKKILKLPNIFVVFFAQGEEYFSSLPVLGKKGKTARKSAFLSIILEDKRKMRNFAALN